MKKAICNIQFDEVIWNRISTEVDNQGKIFIGKEEYIQVLPLTDANFMPGTEKVIEIIFEYTSQIALGLFVSWIYDKLNQLKVKKLIVNKKEHEITNKKSVQDAIIKSIDEE